MITLAQIGVGVWGQNHIRVLSNLANCNLKICCDERKEALDKIDTIYNRRFKLTTCFEDILSDRDITAVIIATPAATHAEFAIKALTSGKHVFVEKPLALNLQDAQKIIDIAHRHRRILMVGHLLLYHPAVLKIKSYIQNGDLGDIFYIYSMRVNLGRVREEENALWSLTSHDISVAMFLLADVPIEVTAKGESYLRKGVEDVVFVTLRFKKNIMAQIHASWLDPHKIRKFTIVGSKKMAVFDDMESTEKVRVYDKGFDWQKNYGSYDTFLTLREGDIQIPKIDMIEPLKLEYQYFLKSIELGREQVDSGENALGVLRILDAAQSSLERNGQTVKIV